MNPAAQLKTLQNITTAGRSAGGSPAYRPEENSQASRPRSLFFDWPELPPLPSPGEPVLIRIATPVSRSAARQKLRAVLRRVLADWSGRAPEHLPLVETSHGPRWQGSLAGHSLDISLSYCDGEGWIGLIRGGAIGVDAMRVRPVAEAEAVARHFLGPDVLAAIRESRVPEHAFALAWTEREARLKCLKLGLTEWDANQISAAANCISRRILFDDCTAVAVATAG